MQLPAGTHTVAVVTPDRHGLLRGKQVPSTRWPEIREQGLAMAGAVLHWTADGDVPPVGPDGVGEAAPDMRLLPVEGGVRPLPWRPGTALALCEPVTPEGDPLPRSPRAALRRVLAGGHARRVEPRIGFEVEFHLLDRQTLAPVAAALGCYDVTAGGACERVTAALQRHLPAVGIPVEASNPECGAGQFEVNLCYAEALETADRAVLFRLAVKQLAADAGLVASFMTLPWSERPGSGLHLHHSLWGDGRNLFAGEAGRLSELGRHYLGGLQRHLADLTLVGSPSPNALKRRRPHSFAPMTTSWGQDNRTTALRVLSGRDDAVRIEQRDAAAEANPYLVIAAQVAAGLYGVAQRREPSVATAGNAYLGGQGLLLPDNVPDAVAALAGSALAKEVFPAELLQVLTWGARHEHDLLLRHVSAFERERYLRVL